MVSPGAGDDRLDLGELAERLAAELRLPVDLVRPAVDEAAAHYRQARVKAFVSVLIQRRARQHLRRAAGGPDHDDS